MTETHHYCVEEFRGEICIGYLISRAYAANRDQLEAQFEGADISFSQWRVLICLRDGLAHTAADLSRELSYDKGSMTRIVDQLETRDFIRRKRDREDRRIVFLTLTPEGLAAVNRLVPKLVDYYNRILGDFSSQDVAQLTELLTRFRQALATRAAPRSDGGPKAAGEKAGVS